VKRRILHYSLLVLLAASAVFAAWNWFRPYSWSSDPAARCKVVETLVTQDHSYFWVNVHLKVNPGEAHDLQKPVRLVTARGTQLEPADTTLAGDNLQSTTEIWLKFWLQTEDLQGPLTLRLNGGELTVKSSDGLPDLGTASYRNFTTQHW
jgi:hypothetical protein